MQGSRHAAGNHVAGNHTDRGIDDRAVEAKRLFDSLTQPAQTRPPEDNDVPTEGEQSEAFAPGEVSELLREALEENSRVAEVVELLRADLEATSAYVTRLEKAVRKALGTTNRRIGALEQYLYGE